MKKDLCAIVSLFNLVMVALVSWSIGCATTSRVAREDFYPIGIYGVPSTNDLPLLRQKGFNLVTAPAERGFLDAAKASQLKVLASPGTTAGLNFDPAAARSTVRAFDSHSALWAWYIIDEPDLNEVRPEEVVRANSVVKKIATKPTALVIYNGSDAIDYANIADIMMVDRYPIAWLPLANFPQHVRMTRLALGRNKPLIAVIQAFDWTAFEEMLPGQTNLRAPTYEELRCMTYSALAEKATGIFYFAYDAGKWKIAEHPQVWDALGRVVKEVNENTPLFKAEPLWWAYDHRFVTGTKGWNEALLSAITPILLSVKEGNTKVPQGKYVLCVNNTDKPILYRLRLPKEAAKTIPVLQENRALSVDTQWIQDQFPPYGVHIYGPF